MNYQVSESSFLTIKHEGKIRQFITVPDAVNVIRQRYPDYSRQNLYAAARRINSNGGLSLETVRISNRLLITRDSFEAWLKRPHLGKLSEKGKR